MVYVVGRALAPVDLDHGPQQVDDVLGGQRTLVQLNIKAEASIELVAADPVEVIASGVEEQVLQQVLSVLHARWLARTQPPVKFQQGLVVVGDAGVLVYGRPDVGVFGTDVHVLEQLQYFFVGGVPHRP